MQTLTITSNFSPPGVVAHTNESVAKIPVGTYDIAGTCTGRDGEVQVALAKDGITYLVEDVFLDWIKSTAIGC